jgi:hypothetical protein
MTKRDEFRAATIRTLASRAGHRCSNPECLRPTSGPAVAEDRFVNVGEAAHITAAALGGKRYDPSLTQDGVDFFHLSRQLAHLGEEYPTLKQDMLQRYQGLNGGRAKSILESALIELADAPVIRALVRGHAADHRPYDGGLANAMRNAALGRRPVEGWSANAYDEFSVSLAELRRELFGLALANEAQSRLAEACLVEIEELRDEHGRVDDEPRHPDISSGQPWPIVR